jgi:hypothetical protein
MIVVGGAYWLSRFRAEWRWTRNWLKGARGEEAVGRLLAPLEAAGFQVFHDIATGHGNIDHVVVGSTGVFAIETKAWTRSVYRGPGGVLMCGGFDQTAAVNQARAEAMELKRRVALSGSSVWVKPIIALSATRLRQGPIEIGDVHVLDAEAVASYIQDRKPVLGVREIGRAAHAILANAAPPEIRILGQD